MKMMISSLLIVAGLSAFAAGTTTTTTTTTATTIAATPTAVCQAIVASAKNKDFEGMKKWMTDMSSYHGGKMGAEKMSGKMKDKKEAFYKIDEEHFAMIKDLTCGTELLADNHAVVMSEAQGQKRLIPFIKQNDAWKFDVHTYHSFYADESHAKHHDVK